MSREWKRKEPFVATVAAVERLNPGFVRVRLKVDARGAFPRDATTDNYVKIQFPPPGAPYDLPFNPKAVKKEHPKELWPRQRAFTVRHWDAAAELLTIDFVDHGDTGVVGPWLSQVREGDRVQMRGPKGDYTPSPDRHHLLIGDECVVPSIAATLEALGEGSSADLLVEARSEDHRIELATPAELREHWVYREHVRAGEPSPLIDAARALTVEPDCDVYLHGEAGMVLEMRRLLVGEKGIDPRRMSLSAYWKAERDDEAWREEKSEWKKRLKLDTA